MNASQPFWGLKQNRLAKLLMSALAMLVMIGCQSPDNGETSKAVLPDQEVPIPAGVVEGDTILRYQPPPLEARFTAARSYGYSNENIIETVDQHDTKYNGIRAFRTSTPDFATYYGYDGGELLAIIRNGGEIERVYFVRGDYVKFPVKPGDQWEYRWTRRIPALDTDAGDAVAANGAAMTAEKWETIQTLAGTYKTLKINAANLEDSNKWTIWYAPAIGKVVKYLGPVLPNEREQAIVTHYYPPAPKR